LEEVAAAAAAAGEDDEGREPLKNCRRMEKSGSVGF